MTSHVARVLVLFVATLVLTGSRASQAADGTRFPLFNAGDSLDDLPLAAVVRRSDAAEYVSFLYGDCVAADDAGCPPPLEVQVWPACRRNLALYDPTLAGVPVPQRVRIRGVPAAFLEDGLRLELQADRSTIVIFGGARRRVLRAAAALRRVGDRPSQDPLPPPVPGAVEGTLRC